MPILFAAVGSPLASFMEGCVLGASVYLVAKGAKNPLKHRKWCCIYRTFLIEEKYENSKNRLRQSIDPGSELGAAVEHASAALSQGDWRADSYQESNLISGLAGTKGITDYPKLGGLLSRCRSPPRFSQIFLFLFCLEIICRITTVRCSQWSTLIFHHTAFNYIDFSTAHYYN